MKNLKMIFGFLFMVLLLGCSQSKSERFAMADYGYADEDMIPIIMEESSLFRNAVSNGVISFNYSSDNSNQNDFISSSAAVATDNDSTRRFIRTADLKFRVKNVRNSTYDIERIAIKNDGFVAFTNLTSRVNRVTTKAISADSVLETTHFTVTNSITLRVPSAKLDTTLKQIARNIDYLDHRIIRAEDVALQLLANDLAQKRAVKSEQRLANAIDNRGRRLNETVDAEQLLTRQQERADNAKIQNLSIEDRINFSTINLTIYQRQEMRREILPNEKSIKGYEPSLWTRLLDAAKFGWKILTAILVFLVNLWGIFLIAILIFVSIKYRHKFKQFFKNIFK